MPRISQLTSISSADDADELALVDTSAGQTKRITVANFLSPIDTRLTTLEGFYWTELGRTTLGSAGDLITSPTFTAMKYLRIIVSVLPSGAITANVRFNNDSGNNYSSISSTNGAAATSTTSSSSFSSDVDASAVSKYAVFDVINIATSAKMALGRITSENVSGAGTFPNTRDITAKWHNVASQITRVDISNSAAGDFATGSELVVLGHD